MSADGKLSLPTCRELGPPRRKLRQSRRSSLAARKGPGPRLALLLATGLALSACASSGESALTAPPAETLPLSDPLLYDAGAPAGGPILGRATFRPPGVTEGQPTGTHVGQRVQEMRAELTDLQAKLGTHDVELQAQRQLAREGAARYHDAVARINARLQVGSTPGNPYLVAQWKRAQLELEEVGDSVLQLNTLASEAASSSSVASYLLESTRATYGLYGALEEDHRQLAILEDEVNQTVILIDRLLNELTQDISRAQSYYTAERRNLTALAVAVDNGAFIPGSLANRSFGIPAPARPDAAVARVGRSDPLVVIRFEDPTVRYDQALYDAVSQALERRPDAAFDLVAVAPQRGDAAQVALATNRSRRDAEGVLRSLTSMGLPADRVSLSATTDPSVYASEVHVYVR